MEVPLTTASKLIHQRGAIVLLLVVFSVNLLVLTPELSIGKYNQNDNVLHWMIVQEMAQAHNPFDYWSPTMAYGEPLARLYQPGAHLLVVLAWHALFHQVSLLTVFIWIRFLAVGLLPLSFYACARLLGLDPGEAVGAATLSWLISGDTWGLDIGSYAWAGHGLFPQSVAAHFLLLSIGFGWQAIRNRQGWYWLRPAVLLVLCGWTNLLYGYVGSLTLVLIALLPPKCCLVHRLVKVAKIGAFAGLFALPKLLAWWSDSPLMSSGRWESSREWMWNGLGAATVLKQLVAGDTLDHGRLPVLSLIVLAGLAIIAWRKGPSLVHCFLCLGLAVWLQVSFGSTFWGPAIRLVGAVRAFQIHRLVGAVDVFLILIGGVGIAALFHLVRRRYSLPLALFACALLLEPAVQDRITRMRKNADMGRLNNEEYAKHGDALDQILELVRSRGGRAYAGSFARGTPAGWGNQAAIGFVPLYASLTANRIPNIGFYYLGFLQANDQMYDFDDQNAADYEDANIKTVVSYMSWEAPDFLKPIKFVENFCVWSAPGHGYFDDSVSELEQPGEYDAYLKRDHGGPALVRVAYHQNWVAAVDERPVPVHLGRRGFISIDVPQGEHNVTVRYQ